MYNTSLGGGKDGAVVADTSGQLAAVHSASSGAVLVVPLGGGRMAAAIKDPISGAVLAVQGVTVAPATRRVRQPRNEPGSLCADEQEQGGMRRE